MSRKSKPTEIEVEIIDIDRFIFGRANRKRMEIPDRDTAERISLDTEISL